MKLKKGDQIVFTSGAYSDYKIHMHGCALRNFDTGEELAIFLKLYPEEAEEFGGKFDRFVAWVIAQNIVMEIKVTEWYLGDYGNYKRDE